MGVFNRRQGAAEFQASKKGFFLSYILLGYQSIKSFSPTQLFFERSIKIYIKLKLEWKQIWHQSSQS